MFCVFLPPARGLISLEVSSGSAWFFFSPRGSREGQSTFFFRTPIPPPVEFGPLSEVVAGAVFFFSFGRIGPGIRSFFSVVFLEVSLMNGYHIRGCFSFLFGAETFLPSSFLLTRFLSGCGFGIDLAEVSGALFVPTTITIFFSFQRFSNKIFWRAFAPPLLSFHPLFPFHEVRLQADVMFLVLFPLNAYQTPTLNFPSPPLALPNFFSPPLTLGCQGATGPFPRWQSCVLTDPPLPSGIPVPPMCFFFGGPPPTPWRFFFPGTKRLLATVGFLPHSSASCCLCLRSSFTTLSLSPPPPVANETPPVGLGLMSVR